MKLRDVVKLLDARLICGEHNLDMEVEVVFASDLMSDVLTISVDNALLITGLANLQAIRTAEMLDIPVIIFVRRKKVSEEMMELAEENAMTLIESDASMFRACGILYSSGLTPVH